MRPRFNRASRRASCARRAISSGDRPIDRKPDEASPGVGIRPRDDAYGAGVARVGRAGTADTEFGPRAGAGRGPIAWPPRCKGGRPSSAGAGPPRPLRRETPRPPSRQGACPCTALPASRGRSSGGGVPNPSSTVGTAASPSGSPAVSPGSEASLSISSTPPSVALARADSGSPRPSGVGLPSVAPPDSTALAPDAGRRGRNERRRGTADSTIVSSGTR